MLNAQGEKTCGEMESMVQASWRAALQRSVHLLHARESTSEPARDSKAEPARESWREVDRKLRSIAKRRGALDREELALIRKAIALAIWREVGMTSIREYLEHVMGYGPTVASERVRVAEALDAMPMLERALDAGTLPFSAIREITRIATRKTEAAWLAACAGKNLRQIEDLLAEREPGDRPESPRKPDLRAKTMRFNGVRPATGAALLRARQQLEAERGERLDDDQLLAALAERVGGSRALEPRAKAQVAVTVCPDCQLARQHAAGKDIALRPEERDRLLCDAEWIDVTGKRHANQDVTPAVRKAVRLRDHDRCRVPGCRAASHIEVHHIVPRAQGGSHDIENLLLLCDGHHAALHRGDLRIVGPASSAAIAMLALQPELDDSPGSFHVEDSSGALPVQDPGARADAVLALRTLGFSKSESVSAVESAVGELDGAFTLEQLLRAALRRCPTSTQ